jgi:hypothetical protein
MRTEDTEGIYVSIISLDELMGATFGDRKLTLNFETYLRQYATSYFEI